MRTQDLAITAGIAMITMVGGLALFAPTGVDARRGKKRAFKVDGVEMSLRNTRTTRQPTARLTLVNTTNETVHINPRIALFTEAPGSEFSRMVQRPRERWSDEPLYVLEPRESKTVDIDPAKKIPRRTLAWFTLRSGKRQTETPSFVARPARKAGKLAKKPGRKPSKATKRAANRAPTNRATQIAFLD